MTMVLCVLILVAMVVGQSAAFLPRSGASSTSRSSMSLAMSKEDKDGGIFGAIGGFFEELDAFVDDATSRRLGAGSAFYGKRKSNFYGKEDKGRKDDRNAPDPTEDYQGPSQSGYFKWMWDEETNQMKPVTRMKVRITLS